VLYYCWLDDRKGIRLVKKTGSLFVDGDNLAGAFMSYSSSYHHHFHRAASIKSRKNGDILIPANPSLPGKWPLKRKERERAEFLASGLFCGGQ